MLGNIVESMREIENDEKDNEEDNDFEILSNEDDSDDDNDNDDDDEGKVQKRQDQVLNLYLPVFLLVHFFFRGSLI